MALQADLSREVTGYASYTRGYKGPAYNVFYNLTATGTNVIAAETSDAFEVGLKNNLMGGKLMLNLAGFYAKYHNFQANNPDLVAGVVVSRFTNAGEVSTAGVEADMTWRFDRDTTLSGGWPIPTRTLSTSVAAPGLPPPRSSRWHSARLCPEVEGFGLVRPPGCGPRGRRSVLRHADQLPVEPAVDLRPDATQRAVGTIGAYTLANVSFGLVAPDDKWKLTAQVRNLFNQAYAAAITSGGPSGSYRYQIPRDTNRYWG